MAIVRSATSVPPRELQRLGVVRVVVDLYPAAVRGRPDSPRNAALRRVAHGPLVPRVRSLRAAHILFQDAAELLEHAAAAHQHPHVLSDGLRNAHLSYPPKPGPLPRAVALRGYLHGLIGELSLNIDGDQGLGVCPNCISDEGRDPRLRGPEVRV